MKKGLALLALLCAACASQKSKPPAAESAAAQPAATTLEPSAVIVTTDPHAVMGCRLITRTTQGYDVREPDEWRKLQEETARRGGDTVLVSLKGDRKGDIFSCKKP
ncbi:MAG TPA: hypothetical protein VF999_04035 [Thermoanaerobaculia bacterium]